MNSPSSPRDSEMKLGSPNNNLSYRRPTDLGHINTNVILSSEPSDNYAGAGGLRIERPISAEEKENPLLVRDTSMRKRPLSVNVFGSARIVDDDSHIGGVTGAGGAGTGMNSHFHRAPARQTTLPVLSRGNPDDPNAGNNWKRAAEVTAALKSRIEAMRARQHPPVV